MEIKVTCRSAIRKQLIESVAAYYANELKLGSSKFKVLISTINNLAKENQVKGAVYKSGDKELMMFIDSKLSLTSMLYTIAHEMVHVKQHARGQLKQYIKRDGSTGFIWMGRKAKADCFSSPWELEAYGREANMANKVARILEKA